MKKGTGFCGFLRENFFKSFPTKNRVPQEVLLRLGHVRVLIMAHAASLLPEGELGMKLQRFFHGKHTSIHHFGVKKGRKRIFLQKN